MILRQPRHHHRTPVRLQLLNDQCQIVSQVLVRDHHTLRVAGGPRGVLQKRNALWQDRRQLDGCLGLALVNSLAFLQSIVDADPFQFRPADAFRGEHVRKIDDFLCKVVRRICEHSGGTATQLDIHEVMEILL